MPPADSVNESFTLTFRGHTNHGYNVYGFGENRFGKTEIVGTVTQTGKMEIFKASFESQQMTPRSSAPLEIPFRTQRNQRYASQKSCTAKEADVTLRESGVPGSRCCTSSCGCWSLRVTLAGLICDRRDLTPNSHRIDAHFTRMFS